MNNININLFCKEIGTDMFAGQFMGYWVPVGENEKGLIYKKAFDKNREFSLYSVNIGCFRYSCAELDEFYPIEEEDINFLNEYFQNHSDDWTVLHNSTQAYASYRSALLSAGFTEAPNHQGRFFRNNTDKTAFIVNLTDEGFGITAVYGFTLNSFMGDSTYFLANGEDSDTCKLRESVFLINGEENQQAVEKIYTFYQSYCSLEKDSLLAVAKEKQKAFLNRFAVRLKPLGFKKKNAQWTKLLPSQYQITFYAQKSYYSDQYYFRFNINPPQNSGIKIPIKESFDGVVMDGREIFNWQLMSESQIESLIEIVVNQHILPLCKKYS
jgi:hypothetical protein